MLSVGRVSVELVVFDILQTIAEYEGDFCNFAMSRRVCFDTLSSKLGNMLM